MFSSKEHTPHANDLKKIFDRNPTPADTCTMQKKKLELLSPAKNADYGRAAIDHGADAVYIGTNRFSARSAAGNSLDDIAELINYAHLYNCRVYAAVNTVLYDDELDAAQKLIQDLYDINTDAVIIQDMAFLAMDLPPITLHASTQMHNISAERISFLEHSGIERVILARELSLDEISSIRKSTSFELEAFVHGALCVSYSGQCYMSCAAGGRSANRGTCAQPCRKLYSLTDGSGKRIVENRNLLSLKDMCRDRYLANLVAAGVTSFKIEGRLKDISYVKNITAHYRKKLDELIRSDASLAPSSSGRVNLLFKPDPDKTFNRGYTDYFMEHSGMACPDTTTTAPGSSSDPGSFKPATDSLLAGTSKSLGKEIGPVHSVKGDIMMMGSEPVPELNPGDGLCFFDRKGNLRGFRVEKIERNGYHVSEPAGLNPGTVLFRNHDQHFEKTLEGKSAERIIPVTIQFKGDEEGYSVIITDDLGNGVRAPIPGTPSTARDPERALDTVRTQLLKLGDSPFRAEEVIIHGENIPFYPVSALNEARREAVKKLTSIRIALNKKPYEIKRVRAPLPYPEQRMDYHANVTNTLSRRFYLEHGCVAENGFELLQLHTELGVMATRMCLRRELGLCARNVSRIPGSEPLFLEDDSNRYRLEFDCGRCLMRIIYIGRIK